jgi:hypothetical protein
MAAAGKGDVGEAVAWIAEGHALAAGTDVHAVLRSLVALNRTSQVAQEALKRLTRLAAASDLDTAAVLFRFNEISWPERFRRALDVLAWRSPDKTLAGLTTASVATAHRDDRFVITTLCAIAGVSYRDLSARVDLPADPDGAWTPAQIEIFFSAIDEIVRGAVSTDIPGAAPVRALDLFPEGESPRGVRGWRGVEEKRRTGVSYEVLLAQREAGSAWLAHPAVPQRRW